MSSRHITRNWSPRGLRTWAGLGAVAALFVGAWLTSPLAADNNQRPAGGAVIPIRGEIDDIMRDSVQRRLDQARTTGATTIIFEMDTPGGLVTSALDICRIIMKAGDEVHTVAWVNPEAYSAGAMISVACQEIWMSPASSIGDCAPIMVSPVGGLEALPATERAKAESPILQQFRDAAARNGYNQLLARAMVAVGEEVWWLENTATSERRFVSPDEKKKLIDDVEEAERKWKLVESYVDSVSKQTYPVSQPVDRADTLLTMSQSDAVAFGFAKGVARDLNELSQKLSLSGPPLRLERSAWEKFAAWLNSPLIRGILFAIVVLGAYIEFQHPGLIAPGVTAAIALTIFLAAPYAAGLANVWTFVLLGIGLVLLAIEIFVVPGHGVSGIIGVALVLIAVIGTFVPQEPGTNPNVPFSWPKLPGTWKALEHGIEVLSGSVLVSIIGIVLILRYLPRLAVSRGVIAPNPDAAALAISDPTQEKVQVGDIGVVTGDLRPGGQARFGQDVVDVQSQGDYVVAGRRVQVLKHEGMRIVVRPLPDDSVT